MKNILMPMQLIRITFSSNYINITDTSNIDIIHQLLNIRSELHLTALHLISPLAVLQHDQECLLWLAFQQLLPFAPCRI
jgi:hypothetical protein